MNEDLVTALRDEIARLFSVPEEVESLERLVRMIAQDSACQRDALQEMTEKLEAHGKLLEALYRQNGLLESASREQERLTEEHYSRHVIEPIARHVFQMVNLAQQVTSDQIREQDLCSVVYGLGAQALDLLDHLGIQKIENTEGDPFDRRTMNPVMTRTTRVESRDQTVARVLQDGFARGERVLQSQKVEVYEYEEVEEEVEPWDLQESI